MGRPRGSPNKPKVFPEGHRDPNKIYCSCDAVIDIEIAYLNLKYDRFSDSATLTLQCQECGKTSSGSIRLRILFPPKNVEKSISALVSFIKKDSVNFWQLYDFLLNLVHKLKIPETIYPMQDDKYEKYEQEQRKQMYSTSRLAGDTHSDFYPDTPYEFEDDED